jgi:capsular exopolysaccharide synthesis family protein
MRKPVQHKIFKLKNQKGLSGAISKMSKLEDCIRKNAAENLDVMPSGPKPPNPSELLASDQTAKILEQLSEQYDYIVIDTPPINVVSDAMGISKSVAGILLVLQYGKTTFEDVDEAMKNISLSDMNMLGFIMNDISTKKSAGSYYSQKYGSKYGYAGYGYGEEEKSSKEEQK